MTAHSLTVVPNNSGAAALGSKPAHRSLAPLPFEIPPQVSTLLVLSFGGSFQQDSAMRALAQAKHEGFINAIPALAGKALEALQPCPQNALVDRLTLLGMSMANGKDAEQI